MRVRQIIKVETIGPECAARKTGGSGMVRFGGSLAEEQRIARPVGDTGNALGRGGTAWPIGVQHAARSRTLPKVKQHLGRVTAPTLSVADGDSRHSLVR